MATRSIFDVHGSYADRAADVGEQKEHGWDHGLGEIVTALIDAGLRIDRLEEHPTSTGRPTSSSRPQPGSGRFVLPDGPGELPLMFSLEASKPRRLNGYTVGIRAIRERCHPPSGPASAEDQPMAKHSKRERERRTAESARVKEIEAAWIGSLAPATAKAFTAAVEAARARGPQPPPAADGAGHRAPPAPSGPRAAAPRRTTNRAPLARLISRGGPRSPRRRP